MLKGQRPRGNKKSPEMIHHNINSPPATPLTGENFEVKGVKLMFFLSPK